MVTKIYQITGRVQGVYFRATTQQRAMRLGLTGWVRNRDDGRVEALASGPESALQEFEKFLWQGPEQALVEEVSAQTVPEPAEFMIKNGGFEVR